MPFLDLLDPETCIRIHTTEEIHDFGGRGNTNRAYLPESSSGYYQVILGHGNKYNRQEVLKILQSFIDPIPLSPIAVNISGENMIFYVDNHKTAQCLSLSDLKIQMKDGWKIQIKVIPSIPYIELNNELKETIKRVMSSRYDAANLHLDLSKFYANAEFLNNDLFVPLNRQNMMLAVFQIIADSVPNLRSLNLSDNKLFSTEHFSMLKRFASDLKILDLSRNKIPDLNRLQCLQGLLLEKLVLDDNPLCDKFNDQTKYMREVRKIFKMLLHLDGVDLPPPVDFDIDEISHKLPQSHGSFMCNVDGYPFSRQFLEQYFARYDNQESRDSISEAYAENANFSMTAFGSGPGVSKYISESRNLKKINRQERRTALLHVGRAEITRFLNTFPKTQHDLGSFTVDLTVFTPSSISLTICGVFRETRENCSTGHALAFTRTFFLMATGSGYNITNDMLSITHATEQLLETAFSTRPSAASQNQENSPDVSSVASIPNSAEEEELMRKRRLVGSLSSQTGMNLAWSEKCLAETNWMLDAAIYAFNEFNSRGEIPSEAFNA
ncbi:hypothetical protein V9T40_011890 [Parthenolecanium corni]|uniref:Nuclear RNA export factor 1 n=1 Tax=Parthenolecanium corni TaxID=536013 RepID=A0AAN9T7N7_9HEMI